MDTLQLRRWRWKRRASPAPELRRAWNRPPSRRTPVGELEFLVCDAEMSGLDPSAAELLSLGWVRVRRQEVLLGSAEHHLIRNRGSVGQSATVHRLRDCELAEGGGTLQEALGALLRAATGSVLVFHNAALDMAFLNRASKAVLGAPLLLPVLDTLLLEQRLMQRRDQTPVQGALRLQACRDRYGLARHDAHNALADALATAELLLAHIAARGPGLRLADLR